MYATYDRAKNARAVAEIGIKSGSEFDKRSSLPLRAFSFQTRGAVTCATSGRAMSTVEVLVPDIGDYKDVEVIGKAFGQGW